MLPTTQQLLDISGSPKASRSNAISIVEGLRAAGQRGGLGAPHRLAAYLSQIMHESGGLVYDREVWGPTPAQERYDTRTDLGNSPEKDGDGKFYRGRTGIQITGKSNYGQFRDWCRTALKLPAPDFVATPDAVLTDPWEGLGPIWYWDTRKLNAYADSNDLEMITRKINGGLNGYADRLRFYTRSALVLLGYGPEEVERFQQSAKVDGSYMAAVDGIDGPKTRAALHKRLVALGGSVADKSTVTAAPVVEEKEVPVKGTDKRGWLWGPLSGISGSAIVSMISDVPWQVKVGLGVVVLVLVVVMLFLGERIIRRAKALAKEIDE